MKVMNSRGRSKALEKTKMPHEVVKEESLEIAIIEEGSIIAGFSFLGLSFFHLSLNASRSKLMTGCLFRCSLYVGSFSISRPLNKSSESAPAE